MESPVTPPKLITHVARIKMPSQDQEIESGADPSDGASSTAKAPMEDSPHHVTGLTDVVTIHINEYLRYYRVVPWVLGSVGVVLLLRFSRAPVMRFRQVADFPVEFVAENRKLSGVVVTTGWNTIGVWHVPTWRWVLRWGTHPHSESNLCAFDDN